MTSSLLRLGLFCAGACVLFGVLCTAKPFSDLGREVLSAEETELTPTEAARDKLISLGWEILDEPTLVRDITVPLTFDEVYTRYNRSLQIPLGYDLTKWAGQSLTLCEFEVVGTGAEEGVKAHLLVSHGDVVGGDISSVRLDGFMWGLISRDEAPL